MRELRTKYRRFQRMNWQNDFQIHDGKRTKRGALIAVWVAVFFASAAFYHAHIKPDVQALSDAARERVIVMKKVG